MSWHLHFVQAIAMVLSDGRLAVLVSIEQDDWEATVEELALPRQLNGSDGSTTADTNIFSVGCVTSPDGIDLKGSRCA